MLTSAVVDSHPSSFQPARRKAGLDVLLLLGAAKRLGPHLLAELAELLLAGSACQAVRRCEAIWADTLMANEPCCVWRYPLHNGQFRVDTASQPVLEGDLETTGLVE